MKLTTATVVASLAAMAAARPAIDSQLTQEQFEADAAGSSRREQRAVRIFSGYANVRFYPIFYVFKLKWQFLIL